MSGFNSCECNHVNKVSPVSNFNTLTWQGVGAQHTAARTTTIDDTNDA